MSPCAGGRPPGPMECGYQVKAVFPKMGKTASIVLSGWRWRQHPDRLKITDQTAKKFQKGFFWPFLGKLVDVEPKAYAAKL